MKLLTTLDNQNKVSTIPQGHLEQTTEGQSSILVHQSWFLLYEMKGLPLLEILLIILYSKTP